MHICLIYVCVGGTGHDTHAEIKQLCGVSSLLHLLCGFQGSKPVMLPGLYRNCLYLLSRIKSFNAMVHLCLYGGFKVGWSRKMY